MRKQRTAGISQETIFLAVAFNVPAALTTKSATFFYDALQSGKAYWRFRGMYCLHLQGRSISHAISKNQNKQRGFASVQEQLLFVRIFGSSNVPKKHLSEARKNCTDHLVGFRINDITIVGSSTKGTCFSAQLEKTSHYNVSGFTSIGSRHRQAPLQLSLLKWVFHVYFKALMGSVLSQVMVQ
jgi:hypothetical protein